MPDSPALTALGQGTQRSTEDQHMSTDNTLSNTLSTLIATLTDLKTALDKSHGTAPDLSQYVTLDALQDEVTDAMRDDDNLGRLAQAVWDDVDHRDLARDLEDYLDMDSKVSDWFDSNFSASDYNLATQDYVDEKVSEVVDEKVDVAEITNAIKNNMGDAVRQIVREELRKILTKGLDE